MKPKNTNLKHQINAHKPHSGQKHNETIKPLYVTKEEERALELLESKQEKLNI